MTEILLTIEGEGISFKKQISEHRAGQIISLLSTAQSPVIDPINLSPTRISEKRSAAATPRSVRGEVKDLPIDASLEGYPGYYDLPTKADKILWILQYAEKYGLNELNSVEIDFVSRQLREPIDTKNFGAFNARNQRAAYVMKSKSSFQITKKGQTHLTGLMK